MPGYWLEPEDYLVRTDRVDRKLFANVAKEAKQLAETVSIATKQMGEAGQSLTASLWASLFKRQPEFNTQVKPSFEPLKTALQSAMELPSFAEARTSTTLDEYASALATCALVPQLIEQIPEEQRKQVEQLNQLQKECEKYTQLSDIYSEAANNTSDEQQKSEYQQQAQNCKQQQQQIEQQIATLNQQVTQQLEKLVPNFHKAAECALQEVNKTMDTMHVFIPGWGLEPGNPARQGSTALLDLAKSLREKPDLKKLAEEIGRLKELGNYVRRTRPRPDRASKTEILTGNNIRTVLPVELTYLSLPATSLIFAKKFAHHELLQRHMPPRTKKNAGPIIVCLDTSGSMMGMKNIWARAFTLALLHIAAREKRAWACVLFGSKGESRVFEFQQPEKATANEVLNIAMFGFWGGTNFRDPLMKAIDLANKSPFDDSDIVFVTDGECRIDKTTSKQVAEAKNSRGMKILAVLMPGADEEGVKSFADQTAHIWAAADGLNDEEIKIIFESL